MDANVSTMTMPKTMPAQNLLRYISFKTMPVQNLLRYISFKGQLISKCPFGVIDSTKIPTKILKGFMP